MVDWQNVTAGHDIDTEWGASGEFFVRHGWTWVGASVQRVGVNGATAENDAEAANDGATPLAETWAKVAAPSGTPSSFASAAALWR